MAESTGISWTRSTFNPWIGCTKVGPGCDHCYAESEDKRRKWGGAVHWGVNVPRMRTSVSNWRNPVKWNAEAQRTGEFWPVFCASLADVFDNEVPQAWRNDLWKLIGYTPYLTWQLVTKRVGNVAKMVPQEWLVDWPPNVWIVATVVSQEEFDRDWPKLREIPAKVRGLSVEPMLGPITFSADVRGKLHWSIYGGESNQPTGPARSCELSAICWGIDQCQIYGIAPFVKQLGSSITFFGEPQPAGLWGAGKRDDITQWPAPLRIREFPQQQTEGGLCLPVR